MNETTALAPVIDRGVLSGAELVARVQRVREVMRDLMEENVHYGRVPGTPRPSLWKPGAELLLMTFRIGPRLDVTDLSTPDEIRYRVKVMGVAQTSGEPLAEGIGEASTNEEKYRWRGAVHEKEWAATPADRRRIKYHRDGKEIHQVRTSPADLANTVLLMAVKRGTLNMTRVVTACSDIFDQDLENLPEELVRHAAPTTRSAFTADATAVADQYGPPRMTLDPDPDARASGDVAVDVSPARIARLAPGVVLITKVDAAPTKNPNVIRHTLTVVGGPSWPAAQTRLTTINERLAEKAESAWHRGQAVAITVTKGKFNYELATLEDAPESPAPVGPEPEVSDREDGIPF
jgi:hypothetical protein